MKPSITYKQLRDELEKRGWKAELVETENFGVTRQSMVFQHPKTDLYVILPKRKPTALVEPIHLLHVRNVLENSGFWDRLIQQNKTGHRQDATDVLQALAGIKLANEPKSIHGSRGE